MTFFFFVLTTVLCKDLQHFLKTQNEELVAVNLKLHSKLAQLAEDFQVQVQEDYFYNKQRVLSFVDQFFQEKDLIVRLFLAQEMTGFVRSIVLDAYLLGGDVEGVSSSQLMKVLNGLMKSIRKAREKALDQENQVFFEQLQIVLMQKKEALQDLQVENSKILAKVQGYQAEIREVKKKIEKCSESIIQVNDENNKNLENHGARTAQLKKSFSNEELDINFNSIEQEKIIFDLQAKNNENILIIEKHNTEISILNSTLRMFNEKVSQLKLELDEKSENFLKSQENFSDFAKTIRKLTTSQAASVQTSEQSLEDERKSLESKNQILSSQLSKCAVNTTTLKSLIKTQTLIISQQKDELLNSQSRQKSLSSDLSKDLNFYTSSNQDLCLQITKYQQELDETLKKVSEKAFEIQDLSHKIKVLLV